jgi:hypothetical protein
MCYWNYFSNMFSLTAGKMTNIIFQQRTILKVFFFKWLDLEVSIFVKKYNYIS